MAGIRFPEAEGMRPTRMPARNWAAIAQFRPATAEREGLRNQASSKSLRA